MGFVVGFRTEHFRLDPSVFQPVQAKIRQMSLQGNAPNFFLAQMPSDSRLILAGMNRLPVPTNFRANPRDNRRNRWKEYTYPRGAAGP